jgi:2-polyprenyl-3-methyl-5-hydroxy-6-metoxy-1,4-benzoquinol methylase
MKLENRKSLTNAINDYIIRVYGNNHVVNILDAGCGSRWRLSLPCQYILTGVDIDENALTRRKIEQKDFNNVICADLKTVFFEQNSFDIIYCENVLQHIDCAEKVLISFDKWLKSKGTIIIIFPCRNSAYTFVTRITPIHVHKLYKKYLQTTNKPRTIGPISYPTYYSNVLSDKALHRFCRRYNLEIIAKFELNIRPVRRKLLWCFIQVLLLILSFLSFNFLSFNSKQITYFIKKKIY